MKTSSTLISFFILFITSSIYYQLVFSKSVLKTFPVETLIDNIYYDNVTMRCNGKTIGLFSYPLSYSYLEIQLDILLTNRKATNAICPNYLSGKSGINSIDVFDKKVSDLTDGNGQV